MLAKRQPRRSSAMLPPQIRAVEAGLIRAALRLLFRPSDSVRATSASRETGDGDWLRRAHRSGSGDRPSGSLSYGRAAQCRQTRSADSRSPTATRSATQSGGFEERASRPAPGIHPGAPFRCRAAPTNPALSPAAPGSTAENSFVSFVPRSSVTMAQPALRVVRAHTARKARQCRNRPAQRPRPAARTAPDGRRLTISRFERCECRACFPRVRNWPILRLRPPRPAYAIDDSARSLVCPASGEDHCVDFRLCCCSRSGRAASASGAGCEESALVRLACIAGLMRWCRTCGQAAPRDSTRTTGSPAASEASRSTLPTIAKS